jgi:hypothetical protein
VWVCGRWVDGSSRGWWYEEYGEYGSESMKSTQPSYETASTRQPASASIRQPVSKYRSQISVRHRLTLAAGYNRSLSSLQGRE